MIFVEENKPTKNKTFQQDFHFYRNQPKDQKRWGQNGPNLTFICQHFLPFLSHSQFLMYAFHFFIN